MNIKSTRAEIINIFISSFFIQFNQYRFKFSRILFGAACTKPSFPTHLPPPRATLPFRQSKSLAQKSTHGIIRILLTEVVSFYLFLGGFSDVSHAVIRSLAFVHHQQFINQLYSLFFFTQH